MERTHVNGSTGGWARIPGGISGIVRTTVQAIGRQASTGANNVDGRSAGGDTHCYRWGRRCTKNQSRSKYHWQPTVKPAGGCAMARTTQRFVGVVLALSVVVVVVLHVLDPDGRLGSVTYLTATCGAAAVAWGVVIRRRSRDIVPILIAGGLLASALGDVTWEIYLRQRGEGPDVSIADVGWMISYVCLGAALLSLIRRSDYRMRRDPDALIDMCIAAVLVTLAVWLVWVEPTMSDVSTAPFVRLVWSVYPVLDAALLALLARTLLHRTVRGSAVALFGAGLVMWLLSDIGYLSLTEWAWGGPAMDVGWMLGAVLLAAAVWTFDGVDTATVRRRQWVSVRRSVGRWRVTVAVVPLAIPWIIELWAFARGWDVNPVPLVLASLALGALVCARTFHLLGLQRESEQLFRAAAMNSSEATLILSADGRLLHDAPGLCALLGDDRVGGAGTDIAAVTERLVDGGDLFPDIMQRVVEHPTGVVEREISATTGDGSRVWLSVRVVNLLDTPGVRAVLVNVHDITDRKRAEGELAYQAFHDPLTSLPNRALFNDRLHHAIDQRARTGLDPAVLFLDVDYFKAVNDRLGHSAGDELLTEVARRLSAAVRTGDTIARLGGDEFAILIEHSRDGLGDAEAVAERIAAAFARPIDIAATSLSVTVSVGIAPGNADATPGSLLRDADTAMYHAKAAGRARCVIYNREMRERDELRVSVESDLAAALQREELSVEYQPVIDLSTNEIIGFEALLRWDHPEIGRIGPDVFIPSAERSGVIIPIGEWVLDTACDQVARWGSQFGRSLSIAVNVSGRQLSDPTLPSAVLGALNRSGLDAGDLILEITETSLISDTTTARSMLEGLRALGVRIAIDDFGTGYSSLSYLQQLPVDILKIDRSFVSGIKDGDLLPDIVRGILDLAHTLRLQTVAEGIESTTQLDLLRANQCDIGQGFLFARSLTPSAAEEILTTPPLARPLRHAPMLPSIH